MVNGSWHGLTVHIPWIENPAFPAPFFFFQIKKMHLSRVCLPLLQLSGKKSAPNDNVKIGYYSFFLLSNDRKRSYESIGMVIY
jgi:hypothetical protein